MSNALCDKEVVLRFITINFSGISFNNRKILKNAEKTAVIILTKSGCCAFGICEMLHSDCALVARRGTTIVKWSVT